MTVINDSLKVVFKSSSKQGMMFDGLSVGCDPTDSVAVGCDTLRNVWSCRSLTVDTAVADTVQVQ